jgi:hypothetical protein
MLVSAEQQVRQAQETAPHDPLHALGEYLAAARGVPVVTTPLPAAAELDNETFNCKPRGCRNSRSAATSAGPRHRAPWPTICLRKNP